MSAATTAATLNTALGSGALLLGLTASLLGAGVLVTATVTKNQRMARGARTYGWLVLLAAVLAVVMMERALITRDFSVKYVQQVGSPTTPALYNVAALWSALEGSILLWILVLSLYVAVMMRRFRARLGDPLIAWSMVTMFVVSGFFFLLASGPANAFQTAGAPDFATCCRGPNPLLQNHVLVVFHPPLLYLGYVGVTVPFAFAIGALVTGRVGEGWLVQTRRWALAAWGFLSIGILLGGWWSYEVLGWGGVWAWDPVENASFLPWLTLTAYLHSVMVQERKGMLRVWNLSLLVSTFALTILGTFLTRSGVVNSVHAFSNGSIGTYLLAFFGLVVVVSLVLIGRRGDELRSAGSITSPVSRESAFLANNIAFAVFAVVVLLGTVFPLFVEALQDRKLAVGPPFYESMSTPIGLALLFLMAVAPALPWRETTAETLGNRLFWPAWVGAGALVLAVVLGVDTWASLAAFGLGGFAGGAALRHLAVAVRRRGLGGLTGRSSGGMVVHLGVVLIAVALVASSGFTREGDLVLSKGAPVSFAGHTFEVVAVENFTTDRAAGVRAAISIDGGQAYAPALTRYVNAGMTVPTPSVRTGLGGDIYLALDSQTRPTTAETRVKVYIKPLTVWLWIGGFVLAIGTVLAMIGRTRRRPEGEDGTGTAGDSSTADAPLTDLAPAVGVAADDDHHAGGATEALCDVQPESV